jgi:molecular chaperone GrpE
MAGPTKDPRDKDADSAVKVVDRRWWVNREESAGAASTDSASASLKPTYIEELERQLADKDRQIQEYLGKYRQAASEFEEARLRLRREISKDIERARREILADLLDVVDNLDRAIDAARQSPNVDSLLQGVDMVRRQFLGKLEGFGVRPIDSTNAQFDPELHEAVTTVPAASPEQDGAIVGIVRRGYRIGDDVLRPAAVAVAKHGDG